MARLLQSALLFSCLCSMALPALAQTSAGKAYTYLWQPRTDDVGTADSLDNKLLKAVLSLSKTTAYTVLQGDSLDFIIRKRFFVSGGQFPHAFQIYLQQILQLNSGVTENTVLHVGDKLQLPEGPQYSASTLLQSAAAVEMHEGGTIPSSGPPVSAVPEMYFQSLQADAFDAQRSTDSHLAPLATRTLKAYFTASPKQTLGAAEQGALYKRIKASRTLSAIDLTTHPNAELAQAQPLDLVPSSANAAALEVIRSADGAHLYPGLIPMAAAVTVNCSGTCARCNDVLGIPANFDFSSARVLIEDSGADLAMLTAHNLQSMVLPQPMNVTYPSPASAQDVTSDHHGSYVYSQLVKPLAADDHAQQGALPADHVYVARVARTVDASGTQYYAMSDILSGWQAFEAALSSPANRGVAQTWIVNMSLFGEDADSSDATPAPLLSKHLLFVVAAGNDTSNTEAALYAFSRFTGPGNAVLSVGATGVNGRRASYSNYHPQSVSLVARGDCICGSPGQLNGTSQAAPLITTAAAALTAQHPELIPVEVMWRLISSADRQTPVAINDSLGGRINLQAALSDKILLVEDSTGTPVTHQLTSITLSDPRITEDSGVELLRVSRLVQAGQANCLSLMHMLLSVQTICPAASGSSTIDYTEDGAQMSVPVGNLVDVILPLPRWRDTSVSFPTIQVSP